MDLLDLLYQAGLYAGIVAFIFLAFLIPLYVQQSRDVHRLRAWAALTPDRGTAEFQAAEYAGRPAPVHATATGPPPAAPVRTDTAPLPAVSAAQRVHRELPAAARATTERHAVYVPEPWWKRFVRRPEPRYLVAIVTGVILLAVGVGVLTVQLRQGSGPATSTTDASAVVPSDVHVAVLNGTDVPGLAAKVGDDLASGGFKIGAITNSVDSTTSRSSVLYERGHEKEAEAVAHQIGIDKVAVIPNEVEQIVTQASSQIGMAPAPVVVIAGSDRTL
jgi:LytR cell envelope-related transcriptional attenuator